MSHASLTADAAAPPEFLKAFGRRALLVGAVGTGLFIGGGLLDKEQLYRSWLPAYSTWLGVALGSLAVLMLQHLTGGSWGIVVRRPLEAATRTIPIMAFGMIPLVLGWKVLYPWADPEAVAKSHILQHQRPFMNTSFALSRAVFFFVLWSAMAWALDRLSRQQDETGDPFLPQKLQRIAGPGLVAFALSVTFFGFDWLMSVNTAWFSSIFGFYMMANHALAAFSFVVLVLWLLSTRGVLPSVYQPRHLHDIGKLLFAFVMVWAYFSVSQLIIIWSGNLPEEIAWYFVRMGPAWKGLSIAVVVLHFVLPFGLLLSADLKRDARRLAPIAALLLVMRWVDLFWQTAPGLSPGRFSLHWLDLAAFVGIGGLFTWLFLLQLGKRALVPIHDPGVPEALAHHG